MKHTRNERQEEINKERRKDGKKGIEKKGGREEERKSTPKVYVKNLRFA
jgi:hypothetical protein